MVAVVLEEMAAADTVASVMAARAPRGRTLVVVLVASRRPPLRTRAMVVGFGSVFGVDTDACCTIHGMSTRVRARRADNLLSNIVKDKMMRATTTLLSLLSLLVAIDGFRPVFKPAGPRALTRSVPRMAPTADGMPTEEGK